ncbi:MAG: GEVED domain-containing protein, partial [Flavobacteriales bacterium]
MKKLLLLHLLVGLFFTGQINAQATISTNFTNNNGSSIITFNFQNSNTSDIIITGISSCTGLTGANTATLWYNPTPINSTTMAVNTTNGWVQVAAQPFTGVANTTTNVGQPMLTGLSFIVPAGTTYGICLSLTSGLRYSTITAGSYTFSGGGCNIITGTNIGFGGTLTSGINNRGFLGSVDFISGNACTGTPNAGNTASTANPVCPGVPFTLSMAGATFSSGLTYQWQSGSSATGPWTNIPGATTSAFTTTQTANTWYQCIVTCTSAATTATAVPLQVTTNTFVNCYCTSASTSAADEEIFNVTLNTLNNTSTCGVAAPGPGSVVSNYSNFTTSVAPPVLAPGVIYPFSVEIGTCNGNYNNWTKAWIDFNQNGLFTDPGELVYTSTAATVGPHIETGTVAVPTGALQGLTRMRVVNVETTVTTGVNPCGTYTWGETEDYFVNIIAPPTCPQPTALNVVSSNLNSGTINWTPGGSETQWQIEYGPLGFTPGTGTIINTTTHPYTIGSLTAYSFYQARVRAVCTPGDSSYWSPMISWNTYDQGQYIQWDNECPTGGFIDLSTSTTATYNNIAYLGEIGITLPFPLLYQGNLITTATIGATGGVKLGTTTAQVNYVMEAGNGLYPFIQQLAQSYAVGGGIYYQQLGTSPNSKFVVQWKNLPHWNSPIFPNGATFELIIDEATQEIYYVYDDVIMGNPTTWDYGADAEIGVRGPQNVNVSMNNQAYLQNNSCVHFYYVDCPNPVALTTSYIFPNEAAFTWTASAAGETSWTVVYGPAGFDPATSGTTLTVTAASVQLLNLIPLANYDMYIYSSCSGGLQSNGLFYNFQTPPICPNPTGFASTAGVDSLMSSWNWAPYTSFYPATGFNLQVVAQDSALYTGAVYALNNNFTDTTVNAAWYPGQAFDVYLQAVCGQDTSVYVGPISLIMPISNDNPCGAHPITVGAPGLLYNNTGATVSAEELQIVPPVTGAQTTTGWANNNLNHTTWFKFVAPASGNVRIDATGVEYNGQIGVYFGTDCSIVPSFTLEGANDDEIDGT